MHTAREGHLPAQLRLTETARPAVSPELPEHLQQQWNLSNREQQRGPCESIKRLVDVVPGYESVYGIHFTPSKISAIHGVAERTFVAVGSPVERSKGWVRVAAEPVGG